MTTIYQAVTESIIEELTQIVGAEHLSASQSILDQHAQDQSFHAAQSAEVAIFPADAEQVAAVLGLANDHRVPVTAWGAGTSIEGNPIPVHGGIVLSLARLDQIVSIHADDFQVTVQAGMGYKDMNAKLRRVGLFFPPDPGANASIGGMVANNAAGIRTVRYGATRDNVLRLQVALADGRLIEVGSRSVKQSSGYDLVHLFTGSEGTLGIITEATFKLAPIPEKVGALTASFGSVEETIAAIVEIRGSGLQPVALEFLDAWHAEALSREPGVELEAKPAIFSEYHGVDDASLERELSMAKDICASHGAINIRTTTNTQERESLWHARHHAYEIIKRQNPGMDIYVGDVAVPISRYAEIIRFIEATRDEEGLAAYMIGHAGDGNIHVLFPYSDATSYEKANTVNAKIVHKALELEGTATGEHGVGIGKIPFMAAEHGESLDVMRAVKATLDPNNILNPGKIFPS